MHSCEKENNLDAWEFLPWDLNYYKFTSTIPFVQNDNVNRWFGDYTRTDWGNKITSKCFAMLGELELPQDQPTSTSIQTLHYSIISGSFYEIMGFTSYRSVTSTLQMNNFFIKKRWFITATFLSISLYSKILGVDTICSSIIITVIVFNEAHK